MSPADLTVLGFDVGSHWTGVAVGQTRTGTASPLQPLRLRNGKPDWTRIEALIREWQPQRLVVGLPTGMDGSPHRMTETARRFARQLEGRFHLPVEFADERLTTREAWQIAESRGSRHLDKPDIDGIAAVLITETWLSSREPGQDLQT